MLGSFRCWAWMWSVRRGISVAVLLYMQEQSLRQHHQRRTMADHPAPSTANIAIACALVGVMTGYFIGQAKSLGLFGGSPLSEPPRRKQKATDASDESSDEEEDEEASELKEFPGQNEECKLVLVVRTDLGMTKGINYYNCYSNHPS